MKVLKPGEKATLRDGRTVTFLHTDDPDCEGCVFECENCGLYGPIVEECGSGRDDGKVGIFVEVNSDERHG